MQHISKVQAQFGPVATDYVNCPVQSGDFTIARMIELVEPSEDWHVLDVATGGGHSAVAISRHVQDVIATDVTLEMLSQAELHAHENGANNISFEYADAANLPYQDDRFDLVTCRLAAHHFEDVPKFLRECYRLLRKSGVLAIVDSHLPSNSGGEYINHIQRIHDPSHVKCLSREDWLTMIADAGFLIRSVEEGKTELNFNKWVSRSRVSQKIKGELERKMISAPQEASEILKLVVDEEGEIKFHFQRIIIVAIKT